MPGVLIVPQYPDVNGQTYSFASIEFQFQGVPLQSPQGGPIGITAIDYGDSLEPGEVRGGPPQVIARTVGKYSANGKLTILRYESEMLRTALATLGTPLGLGFKQVSFNLTVNYTGGPYGTVISDTLVGCRLMKSGMSHKNDPNPLVESVDLSVLYVNWNGNVSYGNPPSSGLPGSKFFT